MMSFNVDIARGEPFGMLNLERQNDLTAIQVTNLIRSLTREDSDVTLVAIHFHKVADGVDSVAVGEDGCEVEIIDADAGDGTEVEVY